MPLSESAKKRLRQNKKRKKENKVFKTKMKEAIKEIRTLVDEGEVKDAKEKLSDTYKAIDKAAKKGVIKKKNASRKKSRLTKLINKAKNEK
ncbi:MAG: 30S ribosomal protein S20 [Patescibacteria group bacterium]